MDKRLATKEDFERNREFCCVHIEVDVKGITITPNRGTYIKQTNSVLMFGCLGTIDWVELGQFKVSSASSYRVAGNIIDHVENMHSVVENAKKSSLDIRDKFVADLKKNLEILQSLEPQINVH